MTACPRYVPDLQSQGDCMNCGWAWEYHSKEARKAMPTKDEVERLAKELSALASREAMTMPPGWADAHELYSDASEAFRTLQAENERLRAALADVRHEICKGPVNDTLWHSEIPAETTVDFICNTLDDNWSYDDWITTNSALGGDHD